MSEDNWREWQNHVLLTLRRLDKDVKEVKDLVIATNTELLMLKVKASVWGGIAGTMVTALIAIAIEVVKN